MLNILQQTISILGLACVGVLFALVFATSSRFPSQTPSIPGLQPREFNPCLMDRDGRLQGDLYGAVRQTIDGGGEDLLCAGMIRPNGDGIRFIFSHNTPSSTAGLMLVIGISNLGPGETGEDLPANVTLIDEATGRFFNAQGIERCWAAVQEQRQLSIKPVAVYRVDGELYCAGSLPSVNGLESVTLHGVRFSGRLSVNTS
ncbi:MAG: hypothetical protein O6763_07945 [Gammaproteobacteria bacterium]|nr:hypothetical protein [Gammaproteobacteria bacterium]